MNGNGNVLAAEMEVEKEILNEFENSGPIPALCIPTINLVACHQLNLSDIYLSMACYYNEDSVMPIFASFFDDQSEVKRFQASQVLRYIADRKSKIQIPPIQRPEINSWGNAVQTLTMALKLERELTKVLEDLNASASETDDKSLLRFVGVLLIKQKKNEDYLENEIAYQKSAEEKDQKQQEGLSEEPAPDDKGDLV